MVYGKLLDVVYLVVLYDIVVIIILFPKAAKEKLRYLF